MPCMARMLSAGDSRLMPSMTNVEKAKNTPPFTALAMAATAVTVSRSRDTGLLRSVGSVGSVGQDQAPPAAAVRANSAKLRGGRPRACRIPSVTSALWPSNRTVHSSSIIATMSSG